MNNTRHGLRAKCNDKCVLVLNGSAYECILKDISISGALIHIHEPVTGVSPGNRCGLHLCSDPRVCPGEYACQISRIAPKEIGLKFINMC